jgi:hypothetical protein
MNVQLAIGATVMTVIMSAFLKTAGVVTDTPSYIEVHSLEYSMDDGVPYITQNRTAQVDGPVLIGKWEAWAYVIVGMELIEVCSGSGGDDYESGFVENKMPFDYWVGEPGCFANKIPHGSKVRLKAKHTWGEGSYREKWSERFIVDKTFFQ